MRPIRPLLVGVLGFGLLAPTVASARPLDPLQRPIVPAPRLITPSIDFARHWSADDAAVAYGDVERGWVWGPQVFRANTEPYAEAPDQQRSVWYLDKARMEIADPAADPHAPWRITSGLLVRELISGQMQIGDNAYEQRQPADVPIAGDLNIAPDQTITYRDFTPLASIGEQRTPDRTAHDPIVAEQLFKGGVVQQDARFLSYAVHLRAYDEVTGHNIAHVWSDALPSDRLLYVAGRPLTEPHWIVVSLGGQPKDVLIQAFERRVLTYTPSNDPQWQIEWGNVGRQYAQWRYGQASSGIPLDPAQPIRSTVAVRDLQRLSPAAARIVAEHGDRISVAVVDLHAGQTYAANGSTPRTLYSTAKVLIMLGVLDQAQHNGGITWQDGLLRSMIDVSDNDAATTLIGSVGGAPALNGYLHRLGVSDAHMDETMWGYSTASAIDMARLTAQLGDCKLLDHERCTYALDLLHNVTPDQRWGVTAGAPDGSTVAVKNGWSPDEDGWTINSVGFVDAPDTQYALVILTRGNATKQAGVDLIERIAREVHGAMR